MGDMQYRRRYHQGYDLEEDRAWPCHPDLPVLRDRDYVPVLGIIYRTHHGASAIKACGVAEMALDFHDAEKSSGPLPKELAHLLSLDSSLRFLRAGESCSLQETSETPHQQPTVPVDSPAGFAASLGIEELSSYDRGYK